MMAGLLPESGETKTCSCQYMSYISWHLGMGMLSYIVLEDLFAEVELGHAVLVYLDLCRLAFRIHILASQSKKRFLGICDIGISWQLHASVALGLGNVWLRGVKPHAFLPS